MSEAEARQIAEQFVKEGSFSKCSFCSIRRFNRNELEPPIPAGDEWVIIFSLDEYEYEGVFQPLIVTVDDTSGEVKLTETL